MTAEMIATPATIEIIYFDAGGGHRNAMQALSRRLALSHPEWRIVPVDLQKLLEPIDPVYRLTARLTGSLKRLLPATLDLALEPVQSQAIYNTALKRGTTLGLGAILPVLQAFVRRYSGDISGLLKARWRDPATPRPDLVVSVIPNFNAPLFAALRVVHAEVPYVTIMTDMVDCPPHFWMEDQDQMMICGTPKALAQARASGYYRHDAIFGVSGMILKENFYSPPAPDAPSRTSLGLNETRPTALIMFGGNGSYRATHTILAKLKDADPQMQTIVLCGNNAKLLASLAGRPSCHAVGFVGNVADYLRLADIFIGKPGPGSLSEAIHMGCPVIVEGNAATMPQERPNLDWIREHDVGIVVKSFRRGVAGAVGTLLSDLERYRANIATRIPENRAVFEVVGVLEGIVGKKPLPNPPHKGEGVPSHLPPTGGPN